MPRSSLTEFEQDFAMKSSTSADDCKPLHVRAKGVHTYMHHKFLVVGRLGTYSQTRLPRHPPTNGRGRVTAHYSRPIFMAEIRGLANGSRRRSLFKAPTLSSVKVWWARWCALRSRQTISMSLSSGAYFGSHSTVSQCDIVNRDASSPSGGSERSATHRSP